MKRFSPRHRESPRRIISGLGPAPYLSSRRQDLHSRRHGYDVERALAQLQKQVEFALEALKRDDAKVHHALDARGLQLIVRCQMEDDSNSADSRFNRTLIAEDADAEGKDLEMDVGTRSSSATAAEYADEWDLWVTGEL